MSKLKTVALVVSGLVFNFWVWGTLLSLGALQEPFVGEMLLADVCAG